MGVEYFSDLLSKYSPNCYYEVPLKSFSGTRIAIDLNNLVYQMYSASVKDLFRNGPPKERPDARDLNAKCIDYILRRLETLLLYNITPICVIDGLPIPEKKRGQAYKKKEDREKYKTVLRSLEEKLYSTDSPWETEDVEKYSRYYKNFFSVDYSIYDTLREILASCGFPVIKTDEFRDQIKTSDAEGLCASLCVNGICIATMSTDSDVHVYGGNFSILALTTKRSIIKGQVVISHTVKVRSLELILTEMDLDFDAFQNICLLCSTDYNPKIKGVGYVKAYETVRKYVKLSSFPFPPETIENLKVAKEIFCSTIKRLEIEPGRYNINSELFSLNVRNVLSIHDLGNHTERIIELMLQTKVQES